MKKVYITVMLAALLVPGIARACGCQGNQYRTGTGLVTYEEAEAITRNYLSTIDASLQPGTIELDGQIYSVQVTDDTGNQVAKLNIDMLTGDVRPAF